VITPSEIEQQMFATAFIVAGGISILRYLTTALLQAVDEIIEKVKKCRKKWRDGE
jgi:hypothetical protein